MIDASIELAMGDVDSPSAPDSTVGSAADDVGGAVCNIASPSLTHPTADISSATVVPTTQSNASTRQSRPHFKKQALSPCCQKRLQKSLLTTSYASSAHSVIPEGQGIVGGNPGVQNAGTIEAVAQLAAGLSDASCCKCGTLTQTPRVERVVFRTMAETWIAIDSFSSVSAFESSITTHGDLFSNFDSARNLLRPQSQRLCRWII